jgi:hypothetical protein
MSIINIDTNNPDLLKKPVYLPVTPGIHVFEVMNDLKIEKVKKAGSDNDKVDVTLVCQDEDENKGRRVFDTLALTENSQWKIAQFAKSCGVDSDAEGNLDLSLFKGLHCRADIKHETYKKGTGAVAVAARVSEYLFETE